MEHFINPSLDLILFAMPYGMMKDLIQLFRVGNMELQVSVVNVVVNDEQTM